MSTTLIDRTLPAARLSQLIIDADKDWAGKKITNFGPGGVDLYSLLTAHASRHQAGGADPMPAGGISRSMLEYPTVDVSFAYLVAINKRQFMAEGTDCAGVITLDSFGDKAIEGLLFDTVKYFSARNDGIPRSNEYSLSIYTGSTTADFYIGKWVAGGYSTLASEAVDLGANYHATCKLSCSGSTLKGYRVDLTTPKLTVTDTSLASGYFGSPAGWSKPPSLPLADFLRAPSSTILPALAIVELPVKGSGKPEDPFEPLMSKSLAEISTLTGLPDFLYLEAKKYDVLKAKGFTDDEIKALLGYIPQHQVDLDSVTWGSFELHPDKAPTAIVTIVGDNPYKAGAIDRQKAKAKRAFATPKSYDEAVALYNQLKKDYPHWLAGKDNFAYQTLGHEMFDWMQNVDFYYGELIEHKAHYQQLKQVPDLEIRNRLNELIERLSKVTVLTDERDKHIAKAREVLRIGW